MIYGLWKSAAGVMTAQYRQGVIANNLANIETAGFKRDLAVVQQRKTPGEELPMSRQFGSQLLEKIGGGTLLSATRTDLTQGHVEDTHRDYDAAIVGKGYFVVEGRDGTRRLTRNGNFQLDNQGRLILADGSEARVLGKGLSPIRLDPLARTEFAEGGQIVQYGQVVGQLALKDAGDNQIKKAGHHEYELLGGTQASDLPDAADSTIRGSALERSNVEPSQELTGMISAMRELEANANMIRYQDQTLGRLVNDVGKVA
jgi:flagellar basal body rod protein FlgG